MNKELLEEVKSFLNFTWTDLDREKRIESYISSSIYYLNDLAGVDIDYTIDHEAHDLLLNRVLYMDSQMLNDFDANYNTMLNELRIKYKVK